MSIGIGGNSCQIVKVISGLSVFLDFFELQSLHDPLVCTFEGQMKFQRVASTNLMNTVPTT